VATENRPRMNKERRRPLRDLKLMAAISWCS
jgi:hypothetical protein